MSFNPLETFEIKIINIFSVFSFLNFYITNFSLYILFLIFIYLFIYLYLYLFSFILPKNWQFYFENIYIFIFDVLKMQAGLRSEMYFIFILSIFSFILCCNLIGIIFYTYTITSQIIITFSLAFSAIIFIIFLGLFKKKIKFFLLFYPSGNINIFLKIFIVIIDLISYIIRPFSLAIRLFANMLAGHTLIHILISFSFFISKKKIIFVIFTLFFIFLIGLLELLIAFIQAYVYTILLCIYLNDSLSVEGH